MKQNLTTLSIAFLSLALLSGCTTLADARKARGQGISQTYAADYETVWHVIPEAVTSLGLQIATVDSPGRCVLAQRGMTAASYGENVAVFADRAGEHATRVEVVSKKIMETNVLAPDWAPDILKKIDAMLAKASSPVHVVPAAPAAIAAPPPVATSPASPSMQQPTPQPVTASPDPMY